MSARRIGALCAAIAAGLSPWCAAQTAAPGSQDPVTVYRVGKVLTMNARDEVINNAAVVVRGGKIAAVGRARDVAVPDGAAVVDMPDAWLVPGFVEAHNHTGASGGDLHDYVYLTNLGLRTVDAVVPDGDAIELAQSGGVTTALLIPGSGNNMSGFGTVIKFAGRSVDDAILKYPGSIKIAQAGNPERYWYGVGRTLMNYNTRQSLERAREYADRWSDFEAGKTAERPLFDPTFDEFRGLFSRQFVASVHTQQYQLVMTTVDMLAAKLKVRVTIDHGTFDGWKVTPLILDREDAEIYTMNGPREVYFDRTQRRLFGNAARWWESGQRRLGVNTDAPVIPQEELPYQAAIACYYGWSPYEATRGITRIGAESLMVEDRVGSIEVGKDADFGLWSGDPIDPRSTCRMLVIDGQVARDVSKAVRPRRF